MTFGCFQFLAIMNKAAINILIKKRFPGWLPLSQIPVIPQKQLKFAPKNSFAHLGPPKRG